jgi:anti-anti-sigma factor
MDYRVSDLEEPSGLTITTTHRPGGIRVLTAVGDVDAATVDKLSDSLASPGRVVVDLSRVGFLGCAGVRCLYEAHERGEGLAVVNGSHMVARSLEVTGADRILDIHATVARAVACLQTRTIAPTAATPNSNQAT